MHKLMILGFRLTKRLFGRRTALVSEPVLKVYNWFKYGDASFFQDICIEVNAHCNRSCVYCPNLKYRRDPEWISEEMFDLFLQRIEKLNWTGTVSYAHFGETLLNKRIVDFVKRTKEKIPGALPKIYTNGDFLTHELMAELVQAGLFNIVISQHDKHPSEEWQERILSIRKKYAPYVTFSVIRDINLGNWGGLVEIPKTMARQKESQACRVPSASLHIMLNGNIVLCCNDYFCEKTFGNIKDNSVIDIWETQEFSTVRRELRKGVLRYSMCQSCRNWKSRTVDSPPNKWRIRKLS